MNRCVRAWVSLNAHSSITRRTFTVGTCTVPTRQYGLLERHKGRLPFSVRLNSKNHWRYGSSFCSGGPNADTTGLHHAHLHLKWYKHPLCIFFGIVAGAVITLAAYNSTYEEIPILDEKQLKIRCVDKQWQSLLYDLLNTDLKTDLKEQLNVTEVEEAIVWVKSIGDQLTKANGLPPLNYNVVHSDVANAFVLGSEVYVFTGVLPVMLNRDGAAMIIGHEIGHALAGHSADNIYQLAGIFLAVSLAKLFGSISHFDVVSPIVKVALDIAIYLPGSREHEVQADKIGLYLMSRAGFDPEEGPRVFKRLSELEHASGDSTPDWLSTHPSTDSRVSFLTELLEEPEIKEQIERITAKRELEKPKYMFFW